MSTAAVAVSGGTALPDTTLSSSPDQGHQEAGAHTPPRSPSLTKAGRLDSTELPSGTFSRPPLTPEQSREHQQVSRGSPDLSTATQQLRGMAMALDRAHSSESHAALDPGKHQVIQHSMLRTQAWQPGQQLTCPVWAVASWVGYDMCTHQLIQLMRVLQGAAPAPHTLNVIAAVFEDLMPPMSAFSVAPSTDAPRVR